MFMYICACSAVIGSMFCLFVVSLCLCMNVYDYMCSPKGGDGEVDRGSGVRGGGGREQRQSGIIVTDRAAP